MSTLHLVKTESGKYFLQGTDDPSQNADFSLFDWDGEGGDPFSLASNQSWEIVDLPIITNHCRECGSLWTGPDDEIMFCEEHPSAIIDTIKSSGVEYDADDTDSFWAAQAQIVDAAISAGIDVPDYARGE